MAKILKVRRSAFEERLLALRKGNASDLAIEVREIDCGDHVKAVCDANQLFQALHLQFHQGMPATSLNALSSSIGISINQLQQAGSLHPLQAELLLDARDLLLDMEDRFAHPLVKFAAKPGRSGPTKESRWVTDGRRSMVAASVAQSRFSEGAMPFTVAANLVVKVVDEKLRRYGTSLSEKLPKGWRRRTAERSNQNKVTNPTIAERMQDWREEFEATHDQSLQLRLDFLAACDTPQAVEQFFNVQVTRAFARFRGALTRDQ